MVLHNSYTSHYLVIFTFIVVGLVLSAIILILPELLAKKKYQKDKLRRYECGFDEIDNGDKKFDVRFYLIAILFIIFDLEIAFLTPWAMRIKQHTDQGFWSMIVFIFILIIGFIYEWKKGALELE